MPTPLPEAQRAPGTHLYKYGFNVDWLEDLIVRHRLYIPNVTELNDPNDSRPRVKKLSHREMARFLVKYKIRREPHFAQVRPELMAYVQGLLHSTNIDDVYQDAVHRLDADLHARRVYSLSQRWNNLAMWAKYANDHAGYCLEFANDCDDRLFGMARLVIYDDSFEMDLTDDSHVTPLWYLFKHPDWRSEEEVRIVLPAAFGGPVFDIAPHLLTRVILGRNMPQVATARIQAWASIRNPQLPVATTVYEQLTRSFSLSALTEPEALP